MYSKDGVCIVCARLASFQIQNGGHVIRLESENFQINVSLESKYSRHFIQVCFLLTRKHYWQEIVDLRTKIII